MRIALHAVWTAGLMLAQSQAAAEPPRVDYMLHCQGCHLVDGRATEGRIPALVGAGRFLSVEGGREFLVRVPGVSLSPLVDDELAELVNWMLYRFSADELPADFAPYTAEEVARYRRSPLVDVERARAELTAALEETGAK